VTTEYFVHISTASIWDDDRDSGGASRSFRQITRGSKVSVFLTRQVYEYAREMLSVRRKDPQTCVDRARLAPEAG
jgi:hypothetical protein